MTTEPAGAVTTHEQARFTVPATAGVLTSSVPDTVTVCTLVPLPHRACCAGAGVPNGDAVAVGVPLAAHDGDGVPDDDGDGSGDTAVDWLADAEPLPVRLLLRLPLPLAVTLPLRLSLGMALAARDRERDSEGETDGDGEAATGLTLREPLALVLGEAEVAREVVALALAAADGDDDCGAGDGEVALDRSCWQQAPNGALSSQLAVRVQAKSLIVYACLGYTCTQNSVTLLLGSMSPHDPHMVVADDACAVKKYEAGLAAAEVHFHPP